MARSRRLGRLLSGVALLTVSALCNCWGRTSATQSAAFAPSVALSSLFSLALYQLPGLFLAAAGALLAGFTVRFASGRMKYPVAIAFGLLAIITAQMLMSSLPIPGARLDPAKGQATPTPKSGEEVWKDGSFKRIHDPRSADGAVMDPDWARNLWGEMNKAIREGSDQVVMMFSTRGCKYCDKQITSLRKAIKTREIAKQGAETALFGDTLRVFIYDYEEFAPVAQKLGVEAFPTMLFFGRPGVTPRLNRGYLDDEKLELVLKDVARGKPDGQKLKRRRRFFR